MFLDKLTNGLIGGINKITGVFRPKTDLASRVEKYTSVEGVSSRQLNIGLWYTQQKKLFFLVIVWTLVAVAAVLWSYSLYYLASYLFVGLGQERENLSALTASWETIQRDYEKNLKVGTAQALSLGNGYYDLVGTISNTNPMVKANLSYVFVVDGQRLPARTAFVFPQDEKLVVSLRQPLSWQPTQVKMAVEEVSWARINRHEIPDWQEFVDSHLNFVVRDKNFAGGSESGLSENLPLNRLSFNIINQTPYNYKQLPLVITLYNGATLVGVERYTLVNFASRQKQEVSLNVVGNFPDVNRLEVVPDVDLLNKDNYGPI